VYQKFASRILNDIMYELDLEIELDSHFCLSRTVIYGLVIDDELLWRVGRY